MQVKALLATRTTYHILVGGRDLSKAQAAVSDLRAAFSSSPSTLDAVQIDVTDDDSISRLSSHVKSTYGRLDTLVNNAGASFDGEIGKSMTVRQAWNAAYDVNVAGTQVVTHAFAPLLLESRSPRLLFVTSGLSSLDEAARGGVGPSRRPPVPAGWPKPPAPSVLAYRSSKTALNMMMIEWARMLKEDGVKVFAISPGFLATGLGGAGAALMKKMGAGEPSVGGEFIRDVVEGRRDQDAGKVIRKDEVQPW